METQKGDIAFTASVESARCDCHRGKFAAMALVHVPDDETGKVLIRPFAVAYFDTEAEADKEVFDFLQKAAEDFLKAHGIKPNPVILANDKETATKMAKEFNNHHNRKLH